MTGPREEPLRGGLSDRVVRRGDTVRRPAGAWTASVHALLGHLERKSFPAPRARGLDESGREVLTFLEGKPALWPWPPVLRELDGVRQVGRLLRRYRDAVADFVPPPDAVWQIDEGVPSTGAEIVCHGDLNPSNLVFRGDRLVGLIDWELAHPASPATDLARAVWTLAPLCPDDATPPLGFAAPPQRRQRVAALVHASGCPDLPALWREIVALQARELGRIEELGSAGHEPWRTFLEHGLAERTRRDQRWLQEHGRTIFGVS